MNTTRPTQSTTGTTRRRQHVASTLILGIVVPLAFIAIASIIAWSWRNDVPNPIAQHWGADGTPDGFGSVQGLITVGMIATAVTAMAFTILGVYAAGARRIAIGTSWAIAGLFSAITLGTVSMQRGLTVATEATEIGGTIGIAIGAMVALGALGTLLSPRDKPRHTSAPLPATAAQNALSLSDDERVAWHGTIGAGTGIYIGLLSVVVTTVLVFVTNMWVMAIFPVLLIVLVTAFSMFRVQVTSRGVHARSLLGVPSKDIPLSTITQALVTETNPLRQFGGWGWRVARDGSVGIVSRKGESLTIEHADGQRFVLTVDDAATAAATVNGLIARARG